MGISPNNSLSFFKVFLEEKSSDKLKLPLKYSLDMLGSLPQRVFLRDRYGNHWPVKLAKIEKQLLFEEGWDKFVQDNSIETGDFLFFRYDGDHVFDVKLTGRNACDKEGVGGPKFKEKEEEHMEADIVDEENEEGNYEEIRELESRPLEKHVDEEKKESSDEELEELENQLLNKQVKRELAKIRKQVQSLKRKLGRPMAKDTDGGLRKSNSAKCSIIHDFSNEIPCAKCGVTKARDHYGADIFKSGILPLPKNPYFVTKIRPNRPEELYIPVGVLKRYSIEKLPDKATLRDSRGRTWSANLSTWSDGRNFYSGGWASFCRLNFVGNNDLCICEFVKGRDEKDLVMQLQVVPTNNNSMFCRKDQQMA